MPNLSKEDIEFIKQYQDQCYEGEFEDYDWEYNPKFKTSNMGDAAEWIEWLEEEDKRNKEEYEDDRYGEITKWWTTSPEKEPIIVIESEDGGYTTWDGAHRVGISFKENMKEIPAFVGTIKKIR